MSGIKNSVRKIAWTLLPRFIYDPLLMIYKHIRFRLTLWKRHTLAYFKVKLNLPLKHRHEKINFTIHVTEHCNLNCASCDNFSPLAEPEFIDTEECRQDIERMAELFDHDCSKISLIGGEPLLHNELVKIIEIVRKNFPNAIISLITNGILLTQQTSIFWEACHENRVKIQITHYPININASEIRRLAEKYMVNLQYSDTPLTTFFNEPVNLKGNGKARENFAACTRGNDCITLRHGKLYPCTFAANIHHFNKKFGTDIPVTAGDYINIYEEDMKGDYILKRLAEPIPVCRYCNMNFKLIKWRRSKLDINEWL